MKTVRIIGFLVVSVLVASCGNLKAPEYVGVKDINVSSVVNDSIVVNAQLGFKNPNRVGGKIVLENLHAMVNGFNLGALKDQKVDVPSRKEFYVPLEIKMASSKLFDSKEGLLGSLLASLFTNKVEIKLEGQATFKKMFYTKVYPITVTKNIAIQK